MGTCTFFALSRFLLIAKYSRNRAKEKQHIYEGKLGPDRRAASRGREASKKSDRNMNANAKKLL